jgi:hypothetical protein
MLEKSEKAINTAAEAAVSMDSDAVTENVLSDEKEAIVDGEKGAGMNEKQEGEKHNPTLFEIMKKNLPWKDVLLAIVIPQSIYHFFEGRGHQLLGIILGLAWCFVYMGIGYKKTRKIDIFPLFTVFLIGVQIITLFFKSIPELELYIKALDNMIYGVLYVVSLFFAKPLIQVFVDTMNISEIPDFIRRTPYYRKAWFGVTLVWGIVNLTEAGLLIYFSHHNHEMIRVVSNVSGWPVMMILLIFSFWYPKFYWGSRIHKIQEYNNLH